MLMCFGPVLSAVIKGRFISVWAEDDNSIFGFSAADFARIRASHMAAENDDPWLILGLESGSNLKIAKSQWKKLAAENHPDKLISKGLPEELIEKAKEKFIEIQEAYEELEKIHKK